MPTSTHQPERLVCSPAGAGGGWELRLELRSDRRERTGEHSLKGASVPQLAGRETGEKVRSCRRDKRLFLASLFPGARGEGSQSAAYSSSRDGRETRLSVETTERGMRC